MASITDCDQVYGPGPGHLHDTGILGNPYPYGECTWYCWQYFKDTQGVEIPGNMGDGTDWAATAHRLQWPVDMSPAVNKIICWSAARYPLFGHVAVCTAVDPQGGGFWVKEMNFTYFADGNDQLTGKIDCRQVTDPAGILGMISAHGVQLGEGGSQGNDLLSALETPLTGIARSIQMSGLYLQAEAMTARSKLLAVSQIGAGMVVMGGGGALASLTLAGHGSPSAGLNRARGGVRSIRRGRRPAGGTAGGQPVSPPARRLTTAERSWLSRNARLSQV